MAEALTANKTLKQLFLESNNLEVEGAYAIARALRVRSLPLHCSC